MGLWSPRARAIPFVPGGPLDVGTIWNLYRTLRRYGRRRWSAMIAAVRIDLAAWRYSRELQREA